MTINTTKKSLLITSLLLMALIVSPACQKAPAEFEIASLEIAPAEIMGGETLSISADVNNIGGTAGAYTVTLTIDGVKAQTKVVKVAARTTETVSFTAARDEPGAYEVEVNELSGTFRVLKPAEFVVSNLLIDPPVAQVGQAITVAADVTNSGEVEGNYSAALLIDGSQVETRELTVGAGDTETVSFSLTQDDTGSYSIELWGLSGLLIVAEGGDVLAQLNAAYPELYQELLRVPDLKEIDDKDNEAIEDIAYLALNQKYKPAFESMLDEGIKNKRKYCTPLEALLWIAYDREFDRANLLGNYSLTRLINDAWKNTEISKNYTSERWQDFDEVVDRLNSPDLVYSYLVSNIGYKTDRVLYGKDEHWATAKQTFNNKAGDCEDHATFAVYCLLNNGYHYDYFEIHENDAVCGLNVVCDIKGGKAGRGHSVYLLKTDNLIYSFDSTSNFFRGRRGPYDTIKDVANRIYFDWEKYHITADYPWSATRSVSRK